MRYWISTGDGKTRGPVTVERLRELNRAGRLTSQFMVCAEGTQEWIPISMALGERVSPPPPPAPPPPPHPMWANIEQPERESLHSQAAAGIQTDLVLAAPAQRFIALVIDLSLIALIALVSTGLAFSVSAPKLVLFGLVLGSLNVWFWSPGKSIVGLGVVFGDGSQRRYHPVVARGLAKIISLFSVYGAIMILHDPERRCLHDRLVGTQVICKR